MTPTINASELWAKAIFLAQDGADAKKAFREIRATSGRDLTKTEADFEAVFDRFKRHPLFASHMLLTMRREEFQRDVVDAMWSLKPANQDQADAWAGLIQEFEKGSAQALFDILATVTVQLPTLTARLENRAQELYPRIYAARPVATESAQLELPFEAPPEQPGGDAAVPEGV